MSGAQSVRLTEYSLNGLEKGGRLGSSHAGMDAKSLAERSISYMQNRQSTASVGSRARKVNTLTLGDRIFSSGKKSALIEGRPEDAPYFNRRMERSRGRRVGSNGLPRKQNDPFTEYKKSGEDHQHLN